MIGINGKNEISETTDQVLDFNLNNNSVLILSSLFFCLPFLQIL